MTNSPTTLPVNEPSKYLFTARQENMSGKKIYSTGFEKQDLSRIVVKNALFYNCNFDEATMEESLFEGCEFNTCSFKGTNMRKLNARFSSFPSCYLAPSDAMDLTVTLTCKTFQNTRVSKQWFLYMLLLFTGMHPIELPVSEGLTDKIIAHVIGKDRYVKMMSLLNRREF